MHFKSKKTFLILALILCCLSAYSQADIVQQSWDLERSNNYNESYEKFRIAVEQYPDSSRAWKGKADMELAAFHDSDNALLDYTHAIALKPKAVWAFFGRGQIKYGRKNYAEAIDDFSKAIELKSDYGEFYNLRGICKSRQKDHYGAIKDITEAINLQPASAVLYYNRAIEYKWIAKNGLAIDDCNKAIELKPGYREATEMKEKLEHPVAGKTNNTNHNYAPAINTISTEEPMLKAKVESSLVVAGQQFLVDFTFNNSKGINFTPPSFEGFDFIGPEQSSSANYINGTYSETVTYSYFLTPKTTGTFTLEPATIQLGDRTISSNTVTIPVVKATAKNIHIVDSIRKVYNLPAQITKQGENDTKDTASVHTLIAHPEAPSDSVKQNLFLKVIPDKTTVYEGEQIVLNAKIFTRFNIETLQFKKFRESKNFTFSNIRMPDGQLQTSKDSINHKAFKTASIILKSIYPKRSGSLKIDADTAIFILDKPLVSKNFFEQFFGASYKRYSYYIISDRPTLQVNPLPPTYKSFSGLVGHFKVNVSLEEDIVKPGDSVHLKVTLIGNGNLKVLTSIPYQFSDTIKPLPPTFSDSTYETEDGLVLSNRTFHYVLIPQERGTWAVPAASINYFDPYKKNYAELAIPGFSLNVVNAAKN